MSTPRYLAVSSSVSVAQGHASWYMPPELRDEIIDHLHADRAALKSCSLTCRAWLSRARYHLFRCIELDSGRTGDAFTQLIRSAPTVVSYIEEMEILGTPGKQTWWETTSQGAFIPWPTLHHAHNQHSEPKLPHAVETVIWLKRMFPPTMPPLVKIKALRLSSLPVSETVTDALYPHFKDITELSLDGCKALALAEFVDLLHAFPRVQTLRLLTAQWLPGGVSPLEARHSSSLKLKRLVMSRKIDIAPLIYWILAEDVHTEMTSLSCSMSGHKCAYAIRDLLHAIGATLEHLSIGFQEARDPTDVLQVTRLDLTQSTGLLRLHISCSAVANVLTLSSYRPSLSWIIIFLSTANSPHLREITFSIRLADLGVLNLEGLDVVLSHSRFSGLRSVTFEIEQQKDSGDEFKADHIRKRMSVMNSKEILHLHTAYPSGYIAKYR